MFQHFPLLILTADTECQRELNTARLTAAAAWHFFLLTGRLRSSPPSASLSPSRQQPPQLRAQGRTVEGREAGGGHLRMPAAAAAAADRLTCDLLPMDGRYACTCGRR